MARVIIIFCFTFERSTFEHFIIKKIIFVNIYKREALSNQLTYLNCPNYRKPLTIDLLPVSLPLSTKTSNFC